MSRTILSNATVVTVDAVNTVWPKVNVVIDNGVIVDLSRDGVPAQVGDTVIDCDGDIVLPGLVNAHAHLAMTLLRGVADGKDLDGFLATVLPIEGAIVSDAMVHTGTELAALECLTGGITTVLDMFFFAEAGHQAADAHRLRLHSGPVFVQFPGPDNRDWSTRMAWAREWMGAEVSAFGSSRWVCPHSTYLLTEPQLRDVATLAGDTGCRIQVHAAETRAEMAQVASLHQGRTPVQVLADTGLLHDRTVLAHCVHVTEADIELIATAGAHVVHNPASNAKLASGLAPIRKMLDAGINVALGTDGSASANDLDLWMAMRLASFMPSLVNANPAEVPATDVIRMATINGAKAAGMADSLGSIEVGKRADLVIMNGRAPAMYPSYDPLSTLAFAASRNEVKRVMVDGVFVDLNGHGEIGQDLASRVDPLAVRVREERAKL